MAKDVNSLLAEAAEQLKREAYASGWKDAVQAIKSALGGLDSPSIIPDEIKAFDPASLSTDRKDDSGISKGPTVGSTPYFVLSAIRAHPGMSSTEVVASVHSNGHNVSDGSIRTTLFRLRDRKLIILKRGKWFLSGRKGRQASRRSEKAARS